MRLKARNLTTHEVGYVQVIECDYFGRPTSVTVKTNSLDYDTNQTWVVDKNIRIEMVKRRRDYGI